MDLRSSNKVKVEGAMSSMTDLVFLLLIFFIILSTMVTTGHDVKVPQSSGISTTKSNYRIFIDKDNQVYFQNNELNIDKKTTISELEANIMSMIGDKKVIELIGDEVSDYQYAVQVIGIAKQNGLDVVVMSRPN